MFRRKACGYRPPTSSLAIRRVLTINVTTGAELGTVPAQDGTLLGLKKPTFLGSVFVDVTSGTGGVRVEVGNRTRTGPKGPLKFKPNTNELGIFSLQAPPPKDTVAASSQASPSKTVAGGAPGDSPSLTIASDGPLQISDPAPGAMTGAKVVSKQGVGVQSSSGEVVFSNTKLNAGQGIVVSSPKRIRFENSSQLAAVTAVLMQGGGTAALEVVNSTVRAPNGEILIDQFDRIQMESAALMASVIRARVVSPSGVLQISNSTLAAGKLLRLYAEGSSGMVEFDGAVNLSGNKIDIAGNTVRVKQTGMVTTGPNTTVYANTRDYNKDGFGKISEHQQGNFDARPPF